MDFELVSTVSRIVGKATTNLPKVSKVGRGPRLRARTANVVGPAVIPWARGLAGVAGVVGSIFAILLSMNTGFTAALVIGVFIYLLGMLALPRTA